jgi:hypothetical protein
VVRGVRGGSGALPGAGDPVDRTRKVAVLIVNGEANHAADAQPGPTGRGQGAPGTRRRAMTCCGGRGWRNARRPVRGRACPAGVGGGGRRPRTERAAANRHAGYRIHRKLERGEIRRPGAHYRTALCAVLGAADCADLGFGNARDGVAPDPAEAGARPRPRCSPDPWCSPCAERQQAQADAHAAESECLGPVSEQ